MATRVLSWLARTGLAGTGLARTRLARTRLARTRLARTRLARTRLARTRLARTGLAAGLLAASLLSGGCSLAGLDDIPLTECETHADCAPANARYGIDPTACRLYQCTEASVCELTPRDADRDGQIAAACGGEDCDDEDDARFLGATETCDQRDNDCDLRVDEGAEAPAPTPWPPEGASATLATRGASVYVTVGGVAPAWGQGDASGWLGGPTTVAPVDGDGAACPWVSEGPPELSPPEPVAPVPGGACLTNADCDDGVFCGFRVCRERGGAMVCEDDPTAVCGAQICDEARRACRVPDATRCEADELVAASLGGTTLFAMISTASECGRAGAIRIAEERQAGVVRYVGDGADPASIDIHPLDEGCPPGGSRPSGRAPRGLVAASNGEEALVAWVAPVDGAGCDEEAPLEVMRVDGAGSATREPAVSPGDALASPPAITPVPGEGWLLAYGTGDGLSLAFVPRGQALSAPPATQALTTPSAVWRPALLWIPPGPDEDPTTRRAYLAWQSACDGDGPLFGALVRFDASWRATLETPAVLLDDTGRPSLALARAVLEPGAEIGGVPLTESAARGVLVAGLSTSAGGGALRVRRVSLRDGAPLPGIDEIGDGSLRAATLFTDATGAPRAVTASSVAGVLERPACGPQVAAP